MVLESREYCNLKGKPVDTGDPKTSTYECAGCGHTCTGFVAWRNHMKKKIRFMKCALQGSTPCRDVRASTSTD